MGWLLVPILGSCDGSEVSPQGERLDRGWDGCEVSLLDGMPSLWVAVATAEAKDWLLGVRYPLYAAGADRELRWLDPDPAVRAAALACAEAAAIEAAAVAARYILFPWQWAEPAGLDRRTARDAGRYACERLAGVSARHRVEVILALGGTDPPPVADDLRRECFAEFPALAICLDTVQLEQTAQARGQAPSALVRGWAPWARHLHLHAGGRANGQYHTLPAPQAESDPESEPASIPAAGAIAAAVLAAQPGCRVVLIHDSAGVAEISLAAAFTWARGLVRNVGR